MIIVFFFVVFCNKALLTFIKNVKERNSSLKQSAVILVNRKISI